MTQSFPTLRFRTWFGAMLLVCLFAWLAIGKTPPVPPPQKAKAPPAPTTTPSPFPVIQRTEPVPAVAARGTGLTFRGENIPAKCDELKVYLNGNESGTKVYCVDATTFILGIPLEIPLGKYNMSVKYKDVPLSLPNAELTIFNQTGRAELKVTAVVPLVTYPEGEAARAQSATGSATAAASPAPEIYGFDVIGEGFSKVPQDNGLLINQREIPVCWDGDPNFQKCLEERNAAKKNDQNGRNGVTWAIGKVVSEQQLRFDWAVPEKDKGGAHLQVRVGQDYSAPFDVTLSRYASLVPKMISIMIVLLLFAIVLFLFRGFRDKIAGKKYSIISALFLDAETDTYSLSRFQFFVWTAVAILAYLYLLLSRSLIQGRLEFVDVPVGIPGIVFVSAGTTVIAQAITKSNGPKGAGDIHPSFADLVSTGGVVVPERFQFFVWTVIGAAVFIFLVFLNDPGTIKDLPQVPTGFLALMGVSSAGYLGGKAARSAGPIIDEIVVRLSSLELAIKGRVLSKDASFRINDEDVDSGLIEHLKPEIVDADDQGDATMAKLLRLRILTPKPDWFKDGARLTIINPDGQKAAWTYRVGPAVTDPIQITRVPDTDNVIFRMKGVNLSSETTVAIESPEGTPWTGAVTSSFADDTIETRTTNPHSGVLVLTNPDGRIARLPFTVQ